MEALVNKTTFASTLIDTGNLSYALICPYFAKRSGLQCMDITPRKLEGVVGTKAQIDQVARLTINLEGYRETLFGYIGPAHPGYDIILGRPWMNKREVTIAPSKKSIYIRSTGQRLRFLSTEDRPISHRPGFVKQINAAAYSTWIRKHKTDKSVQVFAASLADIQKALEPKKKVDF